MAAEGDLTSDALLRVACPCELTSRAHIDLEIELERLQARVQLLEQMLQQQGIALPSIESPPPAANSPDTLRSSEGVRSIVSQGAPTTPPDQPTQMSQGQNPVEPETHSPPHQSSDGGCIRSSNPQQRPHPTRKTAGKKGSTSRWRVAKPPPPAPNRATAFDGVLRSRFLEKIRQPTWDVDMPGTFES